MTDQPITAETRIELLMGQIAAAGMAKFLKNRAHYKRDSNGEYSWAYTGTQLFIPITGAEIDQIERLAHGRSTQGIRFKVNGTLWGRAHVWVPYAYPRNFLVIELAEEHQYTPETVLAFARMGGFDTTGFDMSLLAIEKYEMPDDFELVF